MNWSTTQRSECNNLDAWKVAKVEVTKHVLGLSIDFNVVSVNSRLLRYVVILSLTLLFLELEGDSAHRSLLDALHEMGNETCNHVAQSLRGDDSYFISNSLVGLEIESETGVVLLNDDACCLFDELGSDTTLQHKIILNHWIVH